MSNEQEHSRRFASEDEVAFDKELIAILWREFDAVIEAKGKEPEFDEGEDVENFPVLKSLNFVIDQRENPETVFQGEFVECKKMREAIVIYSGESKIMLDLSGIFKSSDEKWIVIGLTPADIYRPQFRFITTDLVTNFRNNLQISKLFVAISSHGQGLEGVIFGDVPGDPGDEQSYLAYFKEKPEEFKNLPIVKFDKLKDLEEISLSLMRGSTFERLKYIINQLGLGNILERAEFQKQIEEENSNLS